MIDRRVLLAGGGALVGVIGGLAAALNGAPLAGGVAGLGAVAAAAGVLWAPTGTGSAAAPADVAPTDAAADVSPARRPAPATTLAAPATTPPVGSVAPDDHPRLFEPEHPPALPDQPNRGDQPALGDPPVPGPAPVSNGTPPTPPPLLTDPSTGLFSEDYFNIAIEARLAAARRHLRPVSVVLIEVVEGLRVDRVRPTDPGRVAEAVRETLREADTACRRPDGHFALLLEDTPENGAIWTVERIRRRLVDADASLTVWAGLACYPAHAFDKDSILRAADLALVAAREWRQDRIEVAAGE